MTLRPRQLPRKRAQTIRSLTDLAPDGAPARGMLPGDDNLVQLLTSHLRAADLFWISDDMTALAMHAGQQLAEARWATADRITPIGLAVFEGGLGMVEMTPRLSAPVDALAWGPGPDQTLIVWHLATRERALHDAPPHVLAKFPPLLTVREARLPVTVDPITLDELPAHESMKPSRPIIAALAAAWHLMQQPQLVDRTREETPKKDARGLRRAELPDEGVTLISLRRQYRPQDREPDAGSDGRTYRHRWVVSGHWRNQPCGPARSERRHTWIPSYVKGPDGAPLLSTEHVNVWRR
ncbi:hypothetical protein H3146_06745 [Streptomyces sp. OF3]|uniref:Uncharacterized protein n=1 Tax=Streptomyces alkaliterrae TaxID=2213162 RepID=A0A7W3WIM9_9ACTN|nr:hypothetical protein [Streptomyces alkaliterrae]MBB1253067.1 hypothetical protein [Streptomyces alkaliterrae]